MPILAESNLMAEFTRVPPAPVFRRDLTSYSCRSMKPLKMPNPQLSPKRRLNFDDPSPAQPLFTHPAADRRDASITTTKSSCIFVDEELQKVAKEASARWNFDFVKGVPLPGRFQWESAATSSPNRGIAVAQENEVELVFADNMNLMDLDEMSSDFVMPSPKVAIVMRRSAKQVLITDAFRCRKRRLSTLTPSSAIDVLPLAENKGTRSKRARLSMF